MFSPHTLITLIAGLPLKTSMWLATGLATVLGAITEEAMTGFTGQWGAAGLAGIIGGCFTATVVLIPKYMEQRRRNKITYAQVRDQEQGAILSRMSMVHESEVAFLKLQVAEAHLVASLERSSKHEVVGELTASQSHNKILCEQLLRAGMEPVVSLHPVDYKTLTAGVDKQIKEIREKAVEDARKALPLPLPVANGNGGGHKEESETEAA